MTTAVVRTDAVCVHTRNDRLWWERQGETGPMGGTLAAATVVQPDPLLLLLEASLVFMYD